MELNNFLEAVFDEEVPAQERLDYLFYQAGEWLIEGSYEKVNQLFFALKEGYVQKCAEHLTVGIGFLTVTYGAPKGKLRDRKKFAHALKKEAESRYPESKLESMFEGLV